MRLRLRTWLGGNRYEITMGLEDGDQPLVRGEIATLWDDMGACRVVSEGAAGLQVWLTAEEAVTERVAVVETLETVGQLPNLGGRP